MGYEVELFIVEVTGILQKKGRNYAQTIASIDLCGVHMADTYNLSKIEDGQKIYMFGLDGNEKFIKDRYGKFLVALDPRVVLDALKSDYKKDNYRRYEIAIAMLKVCIKRFDESNLAVILFGY